MDIIKLLEGRRTYRRFEQREIPQEVKEDILTAGRLASSGGNRQPISYIVVDEKEKVDRVFELTRWAAYLPPEQGQPKENERPAMFIAIVENSKGADTDAGLAISNLTIAAWAHGVGSCIIAACNKTRLAEMFGLKETQELHSVVAFGYPSHVSRIVDLETPDDPDAVKYYLDENRDFVVPKRKLSDLVTYF